MSNIVIIFVEEAKFCHGFCVKSTIKTRSKMQSTLVLYIERATILDAEFGEFSLLAL